MKHSLAALLCAGVFSYSIAVPSTIPCLGASEIPVVVMEASNALYYEVQNPNGTTSLRLLPESQITGEVAITVHDHPVHVVISRQSSEKPVVYYEADLAPQDGTDATEYVFLLDYSELPQNPSHFDITYSADFLQGIYSSAYTVEISVPKSRQTVCYTEAELLVADYHTETTVTGDTRYAYDITFSENATQPVVATKQDAVITDGNATLQRQLQLLWAPLILGDVNADGVVTIIDAYQILLCYATQAATGSLPDNIAFAAADVDQDGAISIFDAYATLIYYAKISAGHNVTIEDVVADNS